MLTAIALISLACLVAVWLLYPLVIAALAACRRRPAAAGATSRPPRVSIVLATREDDRAIGQRIADCAGCSYPADRLEMVVAIDRGVPDADVRALAVRDRLADRDPRCVTVIGDEPGGKAATLNSAVRAAHGEILVFTDTHQRFHPDAIRHLVASLDDPRVGATSGALELRRSPHGRSPVEWYWRFERWLRRCEAGVHSTVGVTGAIWALRRTLWTPLPPHLILDDLYAPMRIVLAGWRVAFTDAARAIDTRHARPTQEYRRKVRTLTGVIQLCAWMPAVLVPVRNPIWLQFVFHKLLRLLTPYWVLGIAVGGAGLVAVWLAARPGLVPWMIAATGAALYARGRAGTLVGRARSAIVWAAVLQAAVVVATVNGLRRRWDVWRV